MTAEEGEERCRHANKLRRLISMHAEASSARTTGEVHARAKVVAAISTNDSELRHFAVLTVAPGRSVKTSAKDFEQSFMKAGLDSV